MITLYLQNPTTDLSAFNIFRGKNVILLLQSLLLNNGLDRTSIDILDTANNMIIEAFIGVLSANQVKTFYNNLLAYVPTDDRKEVHRDLTQFFEQCVKLGLTLEVY